MDAAPVTPETSSIPLTDARLQVPSQPLAAPLVALGDATGSPSSLPTPGDCCISAASKGTPEEVTSPFMHCFALYNWEW